VCVRDRSQDLSQLAGGYLDSLVARGMSASTLDMRRRGVRRLLAYLARCPGRPLTGPMLAEYQVWVSGRRLVCGARRGQTVHPGTVCVDMAAARGFCRWLVAQDHLLLDPCSQLTPLRERHGLPRVLSRTEVNRLLAVPDGPDPLDLRDRAVLELFYASGLRLSELVSLDLTDLDLTGGEALVRYAKRGMSRRVPVGPPAVAALHAYLEQGRELLAACARSASGSAVFLSQQGRRCTKNLIGVMVPARARQAGLCGRVTPHALRHAAALHLLTGGADVRYIQAFLGHSSVGTTARYTRLTLADLKDELARCHPRGRAGTQD
jgi:integrase/recombinase XerD